MEHLGIRAALGELKGHFGTPRGPIEGDVLVQRLYDGNWHDVASEIAEWMFGGAIMVDALEKIPSGGKRSQGVWSTLPTTIPPRHVPMRMQLYARTGYLGVVPPQQMVFDIACILALHKLLQCDIPDFQNARLACLTAMYCGLAELCVHHHLYIQQHIDCNHSDVFLVRKEPILTPDEARCALYLISQMRVQSEPPCMEL